MNEDTNGLVRQYLPKKTDLSKVSNKEIKIIENVLNNKPRKNSKFKILYNSFVHYHPLSNKQHIRNQRHIKIQAKVEFPFQGVKHQ